jgi:hypothetical protein
MSARAAVVPVDTKADAFFPAPRHPFGTGRLALPVLAIGPHLVAAGITVPAVGLVRREVYAPVTAQDVIRIGTGAHALLAGLARATGMATIPAMLFRCVDVHQRAAFSTPCKTLVDIAGCTGDDVVLSVETQAVVITVAAGYEIILRITMVVTEQLVICTRTGAGTVLAPLVIRAGETAAIPAILLIGLQVRADTVAEDMGCVPGAGAGSAYAFLEFFAAVETSTAMPVLVLDRVPVPFPKPLAGE